MAAYGTTTITTSATSILATASPRRMAGLITNFSSEVVYIGFDASVTSSTGLQLNKNDTWETSEQQVYQGPVYGITAANTADVRYQELG
jgi:hypothetical protein